MLSVQIRAAVIASANAPGSPLIIPIVFILLLTAGVLKLAGMLRRPEVNRLCVLALLIFLGAWLLVMVAAALTSVFTWSPALSVAAGMLGAVAVLTTPVLAITGLVKSRRNPGKYSLGKKQGILALVFSGVLIAAFPAAALVSFLQDSGKIRSPGEAGNGAVAFTGTEDFTEFNFRLGKPERPWVRMPKGAVVATAAVVYSKAIPATYAAVVAEKNEAGISREDLDILAEARMKSLASSVMTLAKTNRTISGTTFLRTTIRVEGMKGVPVPIFYERWTASTAEHAYQFLFWSPFAEGMTEITAAPAWMNTFSLIRPLADAGEGGVFADAEVPAGGYATALAAAGWKISDPTAMEGADFIVRNGPNQLALLTVPLVETTGLRDQEIDDRMLDALKVTAKEKARMRQPAGITHSGIPGREYEFDRDVDGISYDFRAKILRKNLMVWMLVTWGPKGQGEKICQEGMDAVRLFTPPAGAPATALSRTVERVRGLIFNDFGINLYRRQEYALAEPWFRAAVSCEREDEAILGNLVDCLTERNLRPEAMEVLKKFAGKGPLADSPKIKARRAQLLGETGDAAGASAAWGELFASGYENDDHLLIWINLQLEADKMPEALKAVRAYSLAHPSAKLTRWEAGVLARMDQYDEAFKLLDTLVTGGKPDLDALYLKGELENDAGRYAEAEKTAVKLVAAGEDTPRTQMILGWSEWHRKAWKSARAAFEKAAAKAPNDRSIQEALSMTNGALGQGTAEVSASPIDPVAIPEVILKEMAAHAPPPEEMVKGHGAIQQQRVTGVFYQSGKPVRITQYYKVKVLDTAGVEAFSTLGLKFYPASERVHVNKLVVRDESGATVQEGKNADAYTSGESGDIVSGAQILRVPVPGLRRGCTLEAAITVEDKGKSTRPPFRRDLLVSGFPTAARVVFFTGDTQSLKVLSAPGLTACGPPGTKGFIGFNLPALRRESFAAPLEEWQPWVMAGPDDSDWKKPALEYIQRLADRLKPEPSTEKVLAEVCKGLSTPREKLSAIVRHVQSTLTYKGLEFGTRALIPSPVAKIQSDHYGDCKDHTLLLYHLLRRAGLKCHPALVDTGWKIRQDIASLDQFDHMILYVPGTGANPWIDATDDWQDLTRFVPSGLAGSQALVLDPGNPRFETIPEAAPTEIRIDRKVAPGTGNGLQVDETLTLAGELASWARAWFLDAPRSEHAGLVRRQWDGYGNVEIAEVTLTDAEDSSKPLGVHLKYTVSDAVDSATRQVSLPFFWERDYLTVIPVDDRRAPFEIKPAMKVESRTRLDGTLAAALIPAALPAEGKTIGGDWHLTQEPETGVKGASVILLTGNSPDGKYPAARWTEFQQGRRALTDKLKRAFLTLP